MNKPTASAGAATTDFTAYKSLTPTASEGWTVDAIISQGWTKSPFVAAEILTAINAALAAVCKVSQDSQRALLEAMRQLAAERGERCEVCNAELSQCGVQGIDGEPSLDCLVCKLRGQLAAEREKTDLWQRQSAFESEHREEYKLRSEQLRKELADERKLRLANHETGARLVTENEQLNKQLAGWERCGKRHSEAFKRDAQIIAELREQQQPLVDALTKCVETLDDPRIGTVDYMEGSRIYGDFKQASQQAKAALAKAGVKPECQEKDRASD